MPSPPKPTTRSGLDSAIWGVCDILRRSNCAGALQYVPELTWILFLRILDESEEIEARNARVVGAEFRPSLEAPYRWRDWAAPGAPERRRMVEATTNAFYDFVNTRLIPHLKGLRDRPDATPRQKVMSEIMSGVDRTRVDTQRNLLDVLDKIHEISLDTVDDTHVFALSQIYEGLLLKMGEKGNDGGQFFTPREIIRAVVQVIAPSVGQTVYDPCCGTGGFLAQAYEFMRGTLGEQATGDRIETLKRRTFYGREKENLVYPTVPTVSGAGRSTSPPAAAMPRARQTPSAPPRPDRGPGSSSASKPSTNLRRRRPGPPGNKPPNWPSRPVSEKSANSKPRRRRSNTPPSTSRRSIPTPCRMKTPVRPRN